MLFIDFGASWQGRSVHTFEGGKQNRWQNLCLKKGWCSTYVKRISWYYIIRMLML